MATIKQIEANRRNAQKSTGPRTPEGKAAVRLNALQHGLRARTVVLPGEKREEFHQLCADLEAEWQPQTRTEQFYLEQMAISQWKLTRMEVGEVGMYKQPPGAKDQVPLLDRLWQAQCRLERSYSRAQRELERLKEARRRQPVDVVPAPQHVQHIPSAPPSAVCLDFSYTTGSLTAPSNGAPLPKLASDHQQAP